MNSEQNIKMRQTVPFILLDSMDDVFDLLDKGFRPEVTGIRLVFIERSRQWVNLTDLLGRMPKKSYRVLGFPAETD